MATEPRIAWRYGYDGRHQLVEIRRLNYTYGQGLPSAVPLWNVNYDYDYAGRLAQRTTFNAQMQMDSRSQFVYVGGTEYDEINGLTGLIVDRYLHDDSGTLLGRLETRDAGFHRDVYATDRLGSVAALYRIDDATPVRMWAFGYSELHPQAYSGSLTDPQPIAMTSNEPFTHSGRWTDPLVTLQWDGSRWLDPYGKRFLTESGRSSVSSNLYLYAGNSSPNPPEATQSRFEEDADSRVARAISEGENGLSGLLFGARQAMDELRNGVKGVKDNAGVRSAVRTALDVTIPGLYGLDRLTDGQASGMVFDTGLDSAAAVPAYAGMQAQSYGLQAQGFGRLVQGDFKGAAQASLAASKANLAGNLGILAGSTPAQLLMAGMQSQNRFVRTFMSLNPQFQLAAVGLAKAGDYGKSLDSAQFERGADSAALVEQLVMLPLDLIGVGEAATAITHGAGGPPSGGETDHQDGEGGRAEGGAGERALGGGGGARYGARVGPADRE